MLHDLIEAFRKNGCCICYLIRKRVHKYMGDFLYEQVNDVGIREQLRKSLGFCNIHAWQLQKLGDGFGESIIYQDLFETIINKLNNIYESNNMLKTFIKELSKNKNLDNFRDKNDICLICKQEKEWEEMYALSFIEYFHEPIFKKSFQNSFGLCIPHLLEVLKKCKDVKLFKGIIRIELGIMDNLLKELKEFHRKHDYRFSKEGFGKEGNSWIKAIEKIVGKGTLL